MLYRDKNIKEIIRHLDKTLTVFLKSGKVVKLDAIEGQKEYKRLNNIENE